jgi:hypothetical protein
MYRTLPTEAPGRSSPKISTHYSLFLYFHHPSTNDTKATTFRFPFFLFIINNNHQSSINPSIINSQSISQSNTPIQYYFNLLIHNITFIVLV